MEDFETIFDDITTIFKSRIGPAVTAMNTEKGDSLLPTFDSTKDFFAFRLPSRDTLPNRKVFFVQGLENPITNSIETATANQFNIAIDVFVILTGDEKGDRKILRYQRIIKGIIEKCIAIKYANQNVRIQEVLLLQAEDGMKANLYLYGTTMFSINVV